VIISGKLESSDTFPAERSFGHWLWDLLYNSTVSYTEMMFTSLANMFHGIV
jgi:hypothetical protein